MTKVKCLETSYHLPKGISMVGKVFEAVEFIGGFAFIEHETLLEQGIDLDFETDKTKPTNRGNEPWCFLPGDFELAEEKVNED